MMRYGCASATKEHAEGDIVPFNPRTSQVETAAKGLPVERWSHSDWGLEIALQCACGWLSRSQNGSQPYLFYIDLAHDEWYGEHIPAKLAEARHETYRQLVEKADRLMPVPAVIADMDAWLQKVNEIAELGELLKTLNKKIEFNRDFAPKGR